MATIEAHYGAYIIHGRGHGTAGTLVQTDYDYPATAEIFGWSLRRVQWTQTKRQTIRMLSRAATGKHACEHSSTDGTVDCRECGMPAGAFIEAAGRFLADRAR
jgi:hypothetical protein